MNMILLYYSSQGLNLEICKRLKECNALILIFSLDKNEYILTVRPDLSTRGHTQWFYFQVKNTKPDVIYRFNIVNIMKPNCLYSKGMRPLMFSDSSFKENRNYSLL